MTINMKTRRGRTSQWKLPTIIVVAVVASIFGLIVIGLTYTPVEHGTVALISRFGRLTGDVFEPGLHWRIPFVDRVVTIPTVMLSYETSDDPGASGSDYPDYPVNAQTVDGQQITIKYTVLFRIPGAKAADIVQNVGRPREVVENVVKAYSRNLARLWAQSYTAEDLYSGEGIFEYELGVKDAMEQEFEKYGVTLDDFLVRKVEFDEDYIRAIEQQQIAQEAIQTAQYDSEAAEFEKERQIRLAEAEAERTKLLAGADAERQRLLADAEAYSIQVRGAVLQEFPEVVQWEFVRNLQSVQWGILPSEGLTPLIPLPSFEGEETPVLPSPTPQPPSESEEGGGS
jgi:regulator of protease activity HflC (stomatin/prohibitin superfamily)